MSEYDVIIVGGGVAGCYLASLLDANVLLLEKNKKVRPKDSGIVSKRIFSFFEDVPVKAEVRRMELVSPSGLATKLQDEKPYAYILKRRRFTRLLRRKARKGATLRYEEVRFIRYDDDGVRVETQSGVYKAKLVIGADGAGSLVRKAAELKPPHVVLGVMVKTKRMEGDIQVFFNKYFSPDYFSWIIPVSREYGLMTGVRPKSYLDYFAQSLQLPKGRIYAYTVPLGYSRSYAYRTLLVGDACGQNKPLTGGGIIFSLTAARIAAENISMALRENSFDASFLSGYETQWKRALGLEIDAQYAARRFYRKLTNQEIDEAFRIFGPRIAKMRGFDYDRLSVALKKLPKREAIRFAVPKIFRAF